MTKNKAILKLRHEAMLKFQEEIFPFTPTVVELQELWGLNTTSSVTYCLREMHKLGMTHMRQKGRRKHYYAKEVKDEDNSSNT